LERPGASPVMAHPANDRRPTVDEYCIEGVITRVRSTHPSLGESIREFLSHFHVEAPGLEARIEFDLLTDADDAGISAAPPEAESLCDLGFLRYRHKDRWRYVEAPAGGAAVADLDSRRAVVFVKLDALEDRWIVPHLLFFPLWVQMLKAEGLFPVHAAAVVKDGRGVLFPASSGSGKSVLSLSLVRAGHRLLGEDTVFLKRQASFVDIVGFPEKISLLPEAVDMFPDIELDEELRRSGRKIGLDAGKLYPGCLADRAPAAAIVFPELTDTTASTRTRMDKARALVRLLPYNLLLLDPASSREHFATLADLVRQAECTLLQAGKDPGELLAAIGESIP